MHRVRRIVEHPKFKRFWTRWRILMWKAVLMRLHSPTITVLEIVIAVAFSLQIRLMFEPSALRSQVAQVIIAKSRMTDQIFALVYSSRNFDILNNLIRVNEIRVSNILPPRGIF